MALDSDTLRGVMRHWATGVAILSARHDGQAHGMTVNTLTSVSLEPPLVLVCIEKVVRTHALVERAGAFAVSFLRLGQEALSDRFAGRETENSHRFEGLRTRTAATGAPILTDSLGYLDCVVVAAHSAGTHTIFVAQVVAAEAEAGAAPLLYHDRRYRALADVS